ncbi:hypothetical protein [Telmatospirillum sp. J64-1]|uniref:hypothetical protein n=1 Tax=Telmatospirillum sp. J64-1 TaxID=2502183 RepID=UPI00115ECE9C|nr:hypothetical protein [Telmatospirillum sp. J64-1]
MSGRTDTLNICFTCDVVDEYVRLANAFTQDLSQILIVPMWGIFLSLVGLWVVIHGIKMMIGKGDLLGFGHEFCFVIIAAVLMSGQGPGLVNNIYSASLSTMGGAASVVLSAGEISGKTGITMANASAGPSHAAGIENIDGMRKLVWVAEKGVYQVFQMATEIAAQARLTDPLPIIYALLLAAPYAILLIVYFAQVVVAIFRVMMFAALSPILMLGFAFGWGRGMAVTGLRTLLAAFMVLFGATVALAVCLYGVASLNVADQSQVRNVREILALDNPTLLVAIILGWLGTAFMAEATGMANSIAGSQLTNHAAGVITAGTVATGLALLKHGKDKGLPAIGGAAKGFQYLQAAAANPAGAAQSLAGGAKELMDRVKAPSFDQGK